MNVHFPGLIPLTQIYERSLSWLDTPNTQIDERSLFFNTCLECLCVGNMRTGKF